MRFNNNYRFSEIVSTYLAIFSLLMNSLAPLANPTKCHAAQANEPTSRQLLDSIAKKPIGSVIGVEDRVIIDGRKIRGSEPIYLGSVIETGNGRARVALGTDTVVDLDNGTRFRVVNLRNEQDPGSARITGMLDYGKLKAVSRDQESAGDRKHSYGSEVITHGGHFKVDGGRYFVDASGSNSKVKFMSFDRPSKIDLIAPQQVLNQLVWSSTSEPLNKKITLLSSADVDGGDSVTSGARRKLFGEESMYVGNVGYGSFRGAKKVQGSQGSRSRNPASTIVQKKLDKDKSGRKDKGSEDESKPRENEPDGKQKKRDEGSPGRGQREGDGGSPKRKTRVHDDNGHGNDEGGEDPSNPGKGGGGGPSGRDQREGDGGSPKRKTRVHDDNGHGNDEGGEDPSNPGKGGGGGPSGRDQREGDGGSPKRKTRVHDDNGHGNDEGGEDPSNPGKGGGGGPSGRDQREGDGGSPKRKTRVHDDNGHGNDEGGEDPSNPGKGGGGGPSGRDQREGDGGSPKGKTRVHDDNGHGNDEGGVDSSNPGKGGGGPTQGKSPEISLNPMELLEVDPKTIDPKGHSDGLVTTKKEQLSTDQAKALMNSFTVTSNEKASRGLASISNERFEKSSNPEGQKKPLPPPPQIVTTSIPGLDPLQKKSTEKGRLNVRFRY